MLTKVTLSNFFSFGKKPITIDLNDGVNLLVGINGSGKSNFLKAIYLLQEAIWGKGIQYVFKKWGGLYNITNLSGGKGKRIKIEYKFELEDLHYRYLLEIIAHSNSKYTIYESLIERYYKKRNGEEFSIIDGIISSSLPTSLKINEKLSHDKQWEVGELTLGQVDDIGEDALFSHFVDFLKEIQTYQYFNLSESSPARQPRAFDLEDHLLPTGENLNAILQKIKNNYTLEYEKIEECLKNINPSFKGVGVNPFNSESYLMLRERNLTKQISTEHISGGTLHYLLLLSILYNPKSGSVICIEEPEMGLHPDMIRSIATSLKYSARYGGTQILVATHSPLLLNEFEVDDVIVFEKNEENVTIIRPIDEDEEVLTALDEGALLGQLWMDGALGGKRW